MEKETRTKTAGKLQQALWLEPQFNPEMLRLARDYHCLKRNQLADLISVSPSFITQVEDGTKFPSPSTMEKIEATLGFPKEFFFGKARFEGVPTSIFRKRVTIPKSIMTVCTARLSLAKIAIKTLLAELEAPILKITHFDPSEVPGGALGVARRIRRIFQIPSGPILNLVDLLEEAGILVVPFEFGTMKIDGCSDWIDERPVIFYNPAIPRSRLRFTLAHELGHLIMHRVLDDEKCEEEANIFAAEFVMPAEDIKPQIAPISIKRLANLKMHWRTSMASILYRAKELQVISTNMHKGLSIKMRQYQYHLEEPNEDMIPFERPHSVDHLIQAYLGFENSDRSQLLEDLKLSDSILSTILPTGSMLRAI